MRRYVELPLVGLLVGVSGCSGDLPPADERGEQGERPETAYPEVAPPSTALLHDVMTPDQLAQLRAKGPKDDRSRKYAEMSMMGALAAGVYPLGDSESAEGLVPMLGKSPLQDLPRAVIGSQDKLVHVTSLPGYQTETSIVANADASILLVGYNDANGFSYTPVSLMGITRSTDGGATWSLVPVGPGGAGVLPSASGSQLRGDPEIKFDPISGRFIYAAIYIRASDGLQGLSVSLSNAGPDAGSSWSLPVEVTPAFISGASADKEFMDVNPVTGRILISWTSFSSGPPVILTSTSDDLGQTWSPAVTVGTPVTADGGVQSSVPRFLPGTSNADSVAYAIWRTSDGNGLRNEGCSRSLDGGITWESQVLLDANWFSPEDQILGSDRVNTSPDLAVDHTTGRVYAVYQRNNATGTGDIALRTFVGPCATGDPVFLNSDPGNDRAQFYPDVTVDQTNGRVHVGWLDQGIATEGDMIEAVVTSSSTQGASWSPPTPVIDRPFHAGYSGFLGDYNQMIAWNGKLHSGVGAPGVAPRFDEGQPTKSTLFQGDAYYDARLDSDPIAPLHVTATAFSEASCNALGNGSFDPGETISLSATIENYVSNPIAGAAPVTGIVGTLSSNTPGVTIPVATSAYPDLAPLSTASNATPFQIQLGTTLVPGVIVDLTLTLSSAQDTKEVPIRLRTGTPGAATTLFSEDFESVTPPALPGGWTSSIGGGTDDPWITSTTLTPTNAAFHDNDGAATEWMRLFSPSVTVPVVAGESYVSLEFDLVYDLESVPSKLVEAYDGMTVRITDQTTGQTLRSIQAENFAESIKTGAADHYPKHLPRNSNASYFQDVSVWSGKSNGVVHAAMKFPSEGMAGRQVQVRFEYTEDGATNCTGSGSAGPCGVAVDNIQLRHVPLVASPCPNADLSITGAGTPNPVVTGAPLSYTLDVANSGPDAATNVVVTDTLPAGATFVDAMGAGFSCSQAAGVVTCSTPSMAVGASASINMTVNAPAPGVVTNTAHIAADPFDPGAADNTTSVQSTVLDIQCGDGVLSQGEGCDDGNTVDGDGCDSNCALTGCGNGVVTEGEACDDGNTVDGDGCSAVCEDEGSGGAGGGGTGGSGGSGGGSGGGAGGSGAGGGGAGGSGGSTTSSSTSSSGTVGAEGDDGCGCRTAGASDDSGAPTAVLELMALAGWAGLRRRRRS